MMRIDVITLFPEILRSALGESILGRAQRAQLVEVHLHQLRDYSDNKHHTVDDRPYGGGPGMVLKCESLFAAIETVQGMDSRRGKVILMSPGGRLFKQSVAAEFQALERLLIVCGHYEGVDERVIQCLVEEEVSIGDYVLSNGAVAALVVIDAVVRLIPGALGNEESIIKESFAENLLEGPQYTRPPEFRGHKVPDELLTGNHAEIEKWRRVKAREKTSRVRPELLD